MRDNNCRTKEDEMKNNRGYLRNLGKKDTSKNNTGMKIAFVGDSFCAEFYPDGYDGNPEGDVFYLERGYKAWTQLLLEHYQATAILKGVSGDCFFHSYLRLMPVLDEADLIIICVSEPDRLANHKLIPMNPWAAEMGPGIIEGSNNEKTFYKASLDYYKRIFSPDFHIMAHLGLIRDLDEVLIEKNKKCIWFGSFWNSFGDPDDDRISPVVKARLPFIPKSGVQGSCPLIKTSEKNVPQLTHSNHFNEQQNIDHFKYIRRIIDNELFGPSIQIMEYCCDDD